MNHHQSVFYMSVHPSYSPLSVLLEPLPDIAMQLSYIHYSLKPQLHLGCKDIPGFWGFLILGLQLLSFQLLFCV